MSRVAVISDIHGNMPALEAVLEDLRTEAPDEVLVAGDIVGRGPGGNEVAHRIKDLGWPTLRGNHEELLLLYRDGARPPALRGTPVSHAFEWMANELDDEIVDYLRPLPFALRPRVGAEEIIVVHGSPNRTTEGIGPWVPEEALDAYARAVDAQVLVCAHTHRPLEHASVFGRIVNIGAVGLPFNRDPRAHYSIFEVTGSKVALKRRVIEYDIEATLDFYEESGFAAHSPIVAQLLSREVRQARPFLRSFMEWAAHHGRPQDEDTLADFDRRQR